MCKFYSIIFSIHIFNINPSIGGQLISNKPPTPAKVTDSSTQLSRTSSVTSSTFLPPTPSKMQDSSSSFSKRTSSISNTIFLSTTDDSHFPVPTNQPAILAKIQFEMSSDISNDDFNILEKYLVFYDDYTLCDGSDYKLFQNIELNIQREMTISFWITPTKYDVMILNLFNHQQSNVGTTAAATAIISSDNEIISFSITKLKHLLITYNDMNVTVPIMLHLNQRQHVAISICNNTGVLYLDGNIIGTLEWPSTSTPTSIAEADIVIGKDILQNNRYFKGVLDNVRIFNKHFDKESVLKLAWKVSKSALTNIHNIQYYYGDDDPDATDMMFDRYNNQQSQSSATIISATAEGVQISSDSDQRPSQSQSTSDYGTSFLLLVEETSSSLSPSIVPIITTSNSTLPTSSPAIITGVGLPTIANASTLPSLAVNLSPSVSNTSTLPPIDSSAPPASAVPVTPPTLAPSSMPSLLPNLPTALPTLVPTIARTIPPTTAPSMIPSMTPTTRPSTIPNSQHPITAIPFTFNPSHHPKSTITTQHPSLMPSDYPSIYPTIRQSTMNPTSFPTHVPVTILPSQSPTSSPTILPSACLEITLVDTFGDGWDEAHLFIFPSHVGRMEISSMPCGQTTYKKLFCFHSNVNQAGDSVVLGVTGYTLRHPWEVIWYVRCGSDGSLYTGGYDTSLTFFYNGISDNSAAFITTLSLVNPIDLLPNYEIACQPMTYLTEPTSRNVLFTRYTSVLTTNFASQPNLRRQILATNGNKQTQLSVEDIAEMRASFSVPHSINNKDTSKYEASSTSTFSPTSAPSITSQTIPSAFQSIQTKFKKPKSYQKGPHPRKINNPKGTSISPSSFDSINMEDTSTNTENINSEKYLPIPYKLSGYNHTWFGLETGTSVKYYITNLEGTRLFISGMICPDSVSSDSGVVRLREGVYKWRVSGALSQRKQDIKWSFCDYQGIGSAQMELTFEVSDKSCTSLSLLRLEDICELEAEELSENTVTLQGSVHLIGTDGEVDAEAVTLLEATLSQEFHDMRPETAVPVTVQIMTVEDAQDTLPSGGVTNRQGRVLHERTVTDEIPVLAAVSVSVIRFAVQLAVQNKEGVHPAVGVKSYLERSMHSGLFVSRVVSGATRYKVQSLKSVTAASLVELLLIHEHNPAAQTIGSIMFIFAVIGVVGGLVFAVLLVKSTVGTACHCKFSNLAYSTTDSNLGSHMSMKVSNMGLRFHSLPQSTMAVSPWKVMGFHTIQDHSPQQSALPSCSRLEYVQAASADDIDVTTTASTSGLLSDDVKQVGDPLNTSHDTILSNSLNTSLNSTFTSCSGDADQSLDYEDDEEMLYIVTKDIGNKWDFQWLAVSPIIASCVSLQEEQSQQYDGMDHPLEPEVSDNMWL